MNSDYMQKLKVIDQQINSITKQQDVMKNEFDFKIDQLQQHNNIRSSSVDNVIPSIDSS